MEQKRITDRSPKCEVEVLICYKYGKMIWRHQ